MPEEFPPQNTASAVLAQIGNGSADADFARAMGMLLDRVQLTHKKAKLVLTVEVTPMDDTGSLIFRASVEARLPKLPPPASQMHIGENGQLLTQMDFLMGGGPSEKPAPLPSDSSKSGRHAIAAAKSPAPLASAPKPKPIIGTDAAAGKE